MLYKPKILWQNCTLQSPTQILCQSSPLIFQLVLKINPQNRALFPFQDKEIQAPSWTVWLFSACNQAATGDWINDIQPWPLISFYIYAPHETHVDIEPCSPILPFPSNCLFHWDDSHSFMIELLYLSSWPTFMLRKTEAIWQELLIIPLGDSPTCLHV